jgi:hypothetical protein
MTSKTKVALVIASCAMIFVIAVVGGYFYWLNQNKAGLQASRTAGLAWGKRTDDNGCWQEAVKRQGSTKDFGGSLKNNSFLLACLAAASNPPNFCDGVPLPGQMIDSITWTSQRCGQLDLSQSDCQGLLRTLQTYCSEYYPKKPGN